MPLDFHKKLADPVHGTIGLTKLEVKLLETPALQRLRNVKQLGLAHYVYPGADFSRLSHSIGVCHIAGQKMVALRQAGANFNDDDEQVCRAAALMHDIGHFPFSHAMEDAVKNYYTARLAVQATAPQESGEQSSNSGFYSHEEIGQFVVRRDKRIGEILIEAGLESDKVSRVFSEPGQYRGIVKSELDADRLDFLPRTSLHTGLPYGSIDLPYLLSNLVNEPDKCPCLSEKAVRAAEHFLLCRLFDRQQVAYHKSVAGFELVLKEAIAILLQLEKLDCSAKAVDELIESGDWAYFDDATVSSKVLEVHKETGDDFTKDVMSALVERKSPKLVFSYDDIAEDETKFNLFKRLVDSDRAKWAKQVGVDAQRLLVWSQKPKPITKGAPANPEDPEESVWVRRRNGNVTRLVDVRGSIVNALNKAKLCSIRVYFLSSNSAQVARLKEIIDRDTEDCRR